MNTKQEKEEQLIRWLEGDLSGQELSAFEASSEFEDYNIIIDAADNISYPTMDEKAVYSSIQDKIPINNSLSLKKNKVIPLRRLILAIAAIAILTFSIVTILPNTVEITSGVGQFASHTLPDGSEVNLNGNSSIDYKSNFESNRTLRLEGEAFFNVEKGKAFVVETNEGAVKVLGTSFNVFSRDNIFVVSCKTGKVKVDSKNQSYVLQKGDRVRIENNKSLGKEHFENNKIGSWINGETYFAGASLKEVVLSFSSVYNTKISLPSSYQNKKFTGSFVHNDLKKALKMVFSPMEIPYTVDNQGKVVLSE